MFVCLALAAIALQGCGGSKIDRLSPDERYKLISDNMDQLVVGGRITGVRWSEDGSAFTFTRRDQRYRFDLRDRSLATLQGEPDEEPATRPRRRGQPARGRQRERETSPDGLWVAVCKDWNVVLEPVEAESEESDIDSGGELSARQPVDITADGHRKFRYGTASWVYGEELDQREAMWWSPDSSKLVFYEFDERAVPDHYLTGGLTELHTTVLTEGYPKPGEPNPIANLIIYDVKSQQMVRVEPAEDSEWYTYAVRFSPDGSELLFNRTNRRQNVLHLIAADLDTGKTRIALTETQETWQDNTPAIRFLDDDHRFIWTTEKTGWKQLELRDLDGRLISTLTRGRSPVESIEEIDEERGHVYYTAFSDRNPLNAHLHRVNLDGGDEVRLTREPFNHSVRISPDFKWFITEYQAANTPPTTALYDTFGSRIATLAESDATKFKELGLERPELFSFKADDGKTNLYGVLHKPSNFEKSKDYPLLIDVYGGPLSQGVRNRFEPAIAACEYGFVIASIDNRGTTNRGKAFEDAAYLRLGDVDLKDQVDGVRRLLRRSYIDSKRVGIFGHSYGGYMAALGLLKYPDVFAAAVASGTVSDWRNYDTIYTERFMRTPQENPAGYDAGSCLKYVDQLQGKLLLLHGMVDDNVHPNNAWQLVDALQKAGKPFEMMFYPNSGHGLGGASAAQRWRFFRQQLIEREP